MTMQIFLAEMAKFWIYEKVPVYVVYGKLIEAASVDDALAMAQSGWADIDCEEEQVSEGDDVIEGLPILYEAEPAKNL